MLKDVRKRKKMLKNEKILREIQGTIVAKCSNSLCKNKLKLTKEETEKTFQCTKCYSGFFVVVKENMQNKHHTKGLNKCQKKN